MKKNVLIIGEVDDAQVVRVGEELELSGATREVLAPDTQFSLEIINGKAFWAVGDTAWAAQKSSPFHAVYLRRVDHLPVPGAHREDLVKYGDMYREQFFFYERCVLTISLLLDLEREGIPCFNSFAAHSRDYKPYRMVQMLKSGVHLPDTAYTQNPSKVREFYNAHSEGVVLKPISSGSARSLEKDDLSEEKLSMLKKAPVCLSAFAEGPDVRVFACDDDIIACLQIGSDRAVDFRGFENEISKIDLPKKLLEEVRSAMKACGLRWSGVDIRYAGPDNYKVLECNTSPMFKGFEESSGVNIAAGLVRNLLKDQK